LKKVERFTRSSPEDFPIDVGYRLRRQQHLLGPEASKFFLQMSPPLDFELKATTNFETIFQGTKSFCESDDLCRRRRPIYEVFKDAELVTDSQEARSIVGPSPTH